MMIVIEGMSKPLYYNEIDAADAALIASVMAEGDESPCSFVSFTDEDGEGNLIPADRVMLLESLHYDDEHDEEVAENGQSDDEYDDEMGEEDERIEPNKA